MQEILALTLQSMHQDLQRLDSIGANLANATTTAYQRQVLSSPPLGLSTPAFSSMVSAPLTEAATTGRAASLPVTASLRVHTDLRPGSLKSTGQSLDVALSGPGFFEIGTEAGPAYTRQGNFQIDARGRLVTAQGFPVMGKGGEIYLNGDHPVIDRNGNVYESPVDAASPSNVSSLSLASAGRGAADAQPVAQLKVLQADDPTGLRRLGDGLLTSDGAFSTLKDADFEVRQGFLENANVSTMHEMVQLMQTMRHFESMQKVALGYDDMTGQAIRKLGELS